MANDWFRKTSWSEADQVDFFACTGQNSTLFQIRRSHRQELGYRVTICHYSEGSINSVKTRRTPRNNSSAARANQGARRQSARSVNAILTASYWEIGRRIVEFAQQGEKRAEYGD
jgi:hypothetical protein